MTARFSGELMFVNTTSFTIPNDLTTLNITFGNSALTPSSLKFKDLSLINASDDLQSPESMAPISIEYLAYELVS